MQIFVITRVFQQPVRVCEKNTRGILEYCGTFVSKSILFIVGRLFTVNLYFCQNKNIKKGFAWCNISFWQCASNMEDEGHAELAKCSPTNILNCTEPLLKRAKPIRANCAPRKYKIFEDDGTSTDLYDCNNENSSIALESVSETPSKFEHETKPTKYKEKLPPNKSALKGQDVAASIHINVEPVARLSPLRTVKKNSIEDQYSSKISVDKAKAIHFDMNGEEPSTPEGMDNGKVPTRRRGRPERFATKQVKRSRKNRTVLPNRRTLKSKPLKSPSTTPLHVSGSPAKRIKLTEVSQGEKDIKESIEDQNLSLDTSEATPNHKPNATHQCNICNKDFTSQVKLENHIHWHVKRKMFKCMVCQRIFKSFNHFIRHQQLHNKAKVEKAIEKSLPQSGANNNNLKTIYETKSRKMEKKHKCNICFQSFAYLGRLKLHLAQHTNTKKVIKRKYRCPVCSKEFVSFVWLQCHSQNCHNLKDVSKREAKIKVSKSADSQPLPSTLPDPQTCEQTAKGKVKTSRASKPSRVRLLDKQNTKSNGNNPIDAGFKTKKNQCTVNYNLVKHKKIHSKGMPDHSNTETQTFKCSECEVTFTNSKLLKEHESTHHQGEPMPSNPKSDDENMHKCNKCGRAFKSLHGMRRHSVIHRGPATPPPAKKTPPSRQSSRLRTSRSSPQPQDSLPTHQDLAPTSPKSSGNTTSSESSHVSPTNMHDEEDLQNRDRSTPETVEEKQQWITFAQEAGQRVYRCGLCTDNDRKFSWVASVRKHVGMIHRDYTDDLVEPPGLYDDVAEETSNESKDTSGPSSCTPLTSMSDSPATQSSNLSNFCTCNGSGDGRDSANVHKNNKSTHFSNCPVHNKESSEPKKTPKGTQVLKCKHCEEEFDGLEREKFQEHELSHELEATEPMGMTYACFECEVEFATANELMDHYENLH